MAEELVAQFEVSGATFYDGTSHPLTRSHCTLTTKRLTIEDARGYLQQIMLDSIASIQPHTGLVNKSVDITFGGRFAIHIYCPSNNRVRELAALISDAMRGTYEMPPAATSQTPASAQPHSPADTAPPPLHQTSPAKPADARSNRRWITATVVILLFAVIGAIAIYSNKHSGSSSAGTVLTPAFGKPDEQVGHLTGSPYTADWRNGVFLRNPCSLDSTPVTMTNGAGSYNSASGPVDVRITAIATGDLNHNAIPDAAVQVLCTTRGVPSGERVVTAVSIDGISPTHTFTTPDSVTVLRLADRLRIEDNVVYIPTCYVSADDGKPCFDDAEEWTGATFARPAGYNVQTYAPPA